MVTQAQGGENGTRIGRKEVRKYSQTEMRAAEKRCEVIWHGGRCKKIPSGQNAKEEESQRNRCYLPPRAERLRQGTTDRRREKQKKKKILRGVKDGANGNGCEYPLHIHIHTYTYMYMHVYIYICVCELGVASPLREDASTRGKATIEDGEFGLEESETWCAENKKPRVKGRGHLVQNVAFSQLQLSFSPSLLES